MDGAIQQVATDALKNPETAPYMLILIGFGLAFLVIDKVVFWILRLRGKGATPMSDNGVKELTAEVRKLTEAMNRNYVEQVKSQEQVDDLYGWHAPDGDGEQKWKGAIIHRIVERTEGIIKSLINDMNMSFKDVTGILTDHIKDDAEQQHTMNNKLSAIERYTKR